MHPFLTSKKFWLVAAVLVCAVTSQFSGAINAYYLRIVLLIGINIILAVSLNLINGYTGQFSLGHAGFMAIGAYVSAYLTKEKAVGLLHVFGGHEFGIVVLFTVALFAGGLAAAVAGLIVGVPSLRLRGDYLAIVTLGFGEIIRVIIQNTDAVGGASGYNGVAGYTTFFWAFALAALTIYIVVSLIDSTYGRGFLTVRDDEVAAEAMGINTTKYKVVAFVLGAFFAGIAGGLYAHAFSSITPTGFDFQRSIEIVVIVILGGMGNTAGVAFAAILLTALAEYLRFVAGYTFLWDWVRKIAANRTIIYALVLIALMLLRPQGLFGGIRAFGGGPSRKALKPN